MTITRQRERPPSRVDELATYLRELAQTKGPEAKLPTARELVRQFAMSRTTVDATLDLLESQHIISRRQGSGIYVSSHIYRKSICVLFHSDFFSDESESPFWGIFWSMFAREMQRRLESSSTYISFHLVAQVTHDTRDLPEDVVSMVQRGNVHGVIAVGMDIPTMHWLQEHHIPVVTFAGPGDYLVGLDQPAQMQMAVSQLVARGCRSLGLWLPATGRNAPEERDSVVEMYRSVLHTHGLALDDRLVKYGLPFPEKTGARTMQQEGYRLAGEVFGVADAARPDGLFLPIDLLTAGALVAFRSLGIVVGQDLQVATHANHGSPLLFGAEDALLLVEIDPAAIVQGLFVQMDAVLAGDHPAPLLIRPLSSSTHPTSSVESATDGKP